MIISCPQCGTRFKIDPKALGPRGKMVRCSKCGHRWFVEAPQDLAPPPEPPPIAAAAPEGEPGMPAEESEKARKEREAILASARAAEADGGDERTGWWRTATAIAGWLLLILVVLGLAGAIVGRNEIVAAFPQSAELYRRVGLSVRLPLGLELRKIRFEHGEENGIPVLLVRGEIHNVAAYPRDVPPLRVALLDEAGRELDFGLFEAERRRLDPGAATRFEARIVDPPRKAVNLAVTFAVRPGSG